jgi:uncharacterized protein YaaR (DUF327 family)
MEIKPTNSQKMNQSTEIPVRSPISVGNAREAAFSEALKDSDAQRRREICTNLLQQIDDAGAELKKAPTPSSLRRYRKLVQAFMKETLNQSYTINQRTSWDRSGNRKVFTTVKKVNESLEALADEVLSKEKGQIDLVAKLDEIRGLLLDLYV